MANEGKSTHKLSPLLGESAAVEELRDFIVGVSLLDQPVLLLGDEGTGKELAARKIHAVGRSARAPFIMIDCDRFSDSEIDDLLFDLGGDGETSGLLRHPTGATCYLAQAEHASSHVCRELVRFLNEERGHTENSPRLVFGTEFTYDELYEGRIVDHAFLEAISPVRLRIPPLRDRIEDIPILCHYQVWLNVGSDELDEAWDEFKETVLPGLMHYPWPGNVNELNELVREFCRGSLAGIDAFQGCDEFPSCVAPCDTTIPDPAAFLAAEIERLHAEFLETLQLEKALGRSDMLVLPETDREYDEYVH